MGLTLQQKIGVGIGCFAVVFVIILSNVKSGLDERDTLLCETFQKDPVLDMKDCPAHASNTSWYITGAMVLAGLLLGVSGFLVFQKKKDAEKARSALHQPPHQSHKLSAEEQQIFELIRSNDGSMYQSDIIKETGHSKVKITRVLDKMESKKLIDRRRRGMTNIIILK